MLSQLIFVSLLTAAVGLFYRNIVRIKNNIRLGRALALPGLVSDRLNIMARVALGQSKMVTRPIAGFMHILIYLGFVLINIEVLEILMDGIFGTHRLFAGFLGHFYNFLLAFFEVLAVGVLLACVVFLARRHLLRVRRFSGVEMKAWPKTDADIILVVEILLMTAFLVMNASDQKLQLLHSLHYTVAGSFPASRLLLGLLPSSASSLIALERFCWWFHIIGILAFLNYLPYSKHFHILLAFPTTYYSNLNPKGGFPNMERVTQEVRLILDPSAVPETEGNSSDQFGAKDIQDLSWKNLMDAYSCTECGRCTSECPANMTGKLLSPRKIMMDTRDRMVELGAYKETNGQNSHDEKSLLGGYISPEELWACTTCNACTQACPINIDPLNIILQLRQYCVMEQSTAPSSLNAMFNNIENNGAPWAFSPADRLNWAAKPLAPQNT